MENRYKEGKSIFRRLSWHFKQEKSVDKILLLVRISLLISAMQRVLRFFLGKIILQKQ